MLFLGPDPTSLCARPVDPLPGLSGPGKAGRPCQARRVDTMQSGWCCVTPAGFRPLHGLEPGPDDPGNGCFGPAGLSDLPDKCSSPTSSNWERSRRAEGAIHVAFRNVPHGYTIGRCRAQGDGARTRPPLSTSESRQDRHRIFCRSSCSWLAWLCRCTSGAGNAQPRGLAPHHRYDS